MTQGNALLGVVVHDLSTPLTVLDMMVRVLDPGREFAKEERVKAHRKVSLALNNIKDILKKVKLLEELRLGKRELTLEPVDPLDVLDQLKILLEARFFEKDIQLKVDSHLEKDTKISADKTLLLNCVLGNILTNAIKFSPRSRFIEINLIHYDSQNILIQIRDYGIGIPKEMLENLFDFTKRTSRPGTENESGSGLGLPLAKYCTTLMGGEIYIESYFYEKGISGSGTSVSLKFRVTAG